jgi:hypothetical protein
VADGRPARPGPAARPARVENGGKKKQNTGRRVGAR